MAVDGGSGGTASPPPADHGADSSAPEIDALPTFSLSLPLRRGRFSRQSKRDVKNCGGGGGGGGRVRQLYSAAQQSCCCCCCGASNARRRVPACVRPVQPANTEQHTHAEIS